MMENEFKKLCRIAGETVARYRLISEGDRILVGLSGGKDSFVLMHLLARLRAAAPVNFSLFAASFDPGFENFGIGDIATYCEKQHWEYHTVALPIPQIIAEKRMEHSPCVLCSRLRRGKLYGLARELKCNKLALGQHLDDIAASFLMSLCRGQGLTTMAPRVQPDDPEAPTVIRPLALVPESLIKTCAAAFDLPAAGNCRYHKTLESGDRAYFKKLVETLALHTPDVRSNIAHSLTRVELEHLLLLPETEEDGK